MSNFILKFVFDWQTQAVIEAELVSLEAQMMFAPSEAKESAKSAMIQRTLMWVAAREETGVPKGLVDEYVKNVLHVLNGKPMKLPPRKKGPAWVCDTEFWSVKLNLPPGDTP